MSLRTDTKRKQINVERFLQGILSSRNVSASIQVVDGPSMPEIAPLTEQPQDLALLGGYYAPAFGRSVETDTTPSPALILTALPQQVPPLRSKSTIQAIVGAQRGSKTHTGVLLAIKQILKPHSKVAYILPSWAKWPIIDPLVMDLASPLIRSRRLADHKIIFHNDSVLYAYSITSGSKEQTSYLGQEFDLVILEEFREFKNPQEHFNSAFSRIVSRAGQMVIVSSPEPNHPLEDMVKNRAINSVPVEVHTLSALNNPYAKPNKENPNLYFDLAAELYPSDVYERNVLGRFAPDKSVDFRDFDRGKHISPSPRDPEITQSLYTTNHYLTRVSEIVRKKIKTTSPFKAVVGMDLGLRNYTLVAGIHTPAGAPPDAINLHYHIKAEIQGTEGQGLAGFMQTLLNHPLLKGLTPKEILIICDPRSANTKSLIEHKSVIQILNRNGFLTLFEPQSRATAKDATNAKFKQGKITIDPSCKILIESLQKFKSGERSQTAISRDPYGHACDAMKYMVSVLSPWKHIEAYVLKHLYNIGGGND